MADNGREACEVADMVTANEQALPSVNDLDLPFFDYNEPGLVGEVYHRRLAEVRQQGWLARSPLALLVLDQESGEFFLRARETAFPGREIADLFGVTGGPAAGADRREHPQPDRRAAPQAPCPGRPGVHAPRGGAVAAGHA